MSEKGIPFRLKDKNGKSAPHRQERASNIRKILLKPHNWAYWGTQPQTFGVDTRIFVISFAAMACCCACICSLFAFLTLAWLFGLLYLLIFAGVFLVLVGCFVERKIIVMVGAIVVAGFTCIVIVCDFVVIILLSSSNWRRYTFLVGDTKGPILEEYTKNELIALTVVGIFYEICYFCPLACVAFGYSLQLDQ